MIGWMEETLNIMEKSLKRSWPLKDQGDVIILLK